MVNWKCYPDGEPKQPKDEVKGERYEVELPSGSVFVASDFVPPKCYLDEEHDDIVQGWLASDQLKEDLSKVFEFAENGDGKHTKTSHRSLDASIMDLADDISFGIHDLEDAIALKLIDRNAFGKWLEKNDVERNLKTGLQPLLDKSFNGKFEKLVRHLFSDKPYHRKKVVGQLVNYFVNRIELKEPNKQFTCPLFRYQAQFDSEEREKALDVLKKIVKDLVTKSLPVQQLEFKGQKIVTELFEAFATDPRRLLEPDHYKRTKQSKGDGDVATARVICDYIAGMSDNYAVKRYRQLFVPRAGSIFDRL